MNPTQILSQAKYQTAGVLLLLVILALQLFFSVRRESQTWDEANHIFTGYRTWTHGDYGLNPEHPPLVKLLATSSLLWSKPNQPQLEDRFFKEDAFLRGKEFLYQNNPDQLLAQTRTSVALLTFLTALIVFLAAREMFGVVAAFIALTLITFDPNILAHGAFVTTDIGLTCFTFLSISMFYRYVKSPTPFRLVVAGLSVGLALAAKHTGVLVLPMLALLCLSEIIQRRNGRHALKLIGSFALTIVIAWVVLWSFYRFRYDARPNGQPLVPTLTEYVEGLEPHEKWTVNTVARFRLLPESYIYGLTDVRLTANYYTSFLLGKVYAHGVWFYFPVAFLIKTTIGVLALSLLTIGVIVMRRLSLGREVLFLLIPPAFYLAVALAVGMNIGVRHILIIYAFLYVLIGGAAWALIKLSRKWGYVVAILLLVHIGSSAMAFPNYIAYSNELWGGPANTYKYLTDSNSDWGQQLKSIKKYLDQRGVKECWFVYFAEGVADPGYYGIPCKPLPTITTLWLNKEIDVPLTIDGTILISASNLSSVELGPGPLDPYGQFKLLKPTAVIDHGVFVFDGKFDLPLAAAISKVQKAQNLAEKAPSLGPQAASPAPDPNTNPQLNEALQLTQQAVALAPDSIQTQLALGDVLLKLDRVAEARACYERALQLSRTIEPDFQIRHLPGIERRLKNIQSK